MTTTRLATTRIKTAEIKTALKPISDFRIDKAPANAVDVNSRSIAGPGWRYATNAANLGIVNAGLPVPADYFKRAPRGLTIPLTKHELAGLGDTQVYFAADADGALRHFGTEKIEGVDPRTLVEALTAELGISEWVLYDASFDAFRFLGITEIAAEIRTGDVTHAGIEVVGSAIGRRILSIALASFRLVCSNGMIRIDYGSAFSKATGNGGGDGTPADWIKAAASEALEGAPHVFEELRAAVEIPVDDDTIRNLDSVFKAERFWGRREVARLIREEPPATLYDLMQHVSYVATHHTPGKSDFGTFRRRRHNQAIAGALAGTLDVCDSCHQLVTAGPPEPEVIEGEIVKAADAESADIEELEELEEVEAILESQIPAEGEAIEIGREVYRIRELSGGAMYLKLSGPQANRGKPTHKLNVIETLDRKGDGWIATGELEKIEAKARK